MCQHKTSKQVKLLMLNVILRVYRYYITLQNLMATFFAVRFCTSLQHIACELFPLATSYAKVANSGKM